MSLLFRFFIFSLIIDCPSLVLICVDNDDDDDSKDDDDKDDDE